MMAGNPSNWWSMVPPSPYVVGSSSLPLNSMAEHHHHHNPQPSNPHSWSQLLLGGLAEGKDEDRLALNNQFQPKKLENLEGRIMIPILPRFPVGEVLLKQEVSESSSSLSFLRNNEELIITQKRAAAASSPARSPATSSCLSSNSMLDFSFNNFDSKNQAPRHNYSSDQTASSTATGGVCKKARVQPTSGQPPFKVRKEKVGDRITALHQLVSPFGKTDTASVLSEAIGYVRFLQSQIEALISPYLGTSSKTMNTEHLVEGERRTCVFPEDPGQLLNDSTLKRKLAPYQESEDDEAKDLRSRGLCLVPVSCTQHVETDINGADYWAQPYNNPPTNF